MKHQYLAMALVLSLCVAASAEEGQTAKGNYFTVSGSTATVTPIQTNEADVWRISCRSDSMTDKRSCDLVNKSAELQIQMSSTTTVSAVCVLWHDFPGRNALLRIDDGKPITLVHGCVGGATAARIVRAMLNAKRLRTRWYTWPNDVAVEDDYEMNSSLADGLAIIPRLFDVKRP